MNNDQRLKNVLAAVFKINPLEINEESSVDTVERWDSLHHLNLVLALESEFNLSLTEDQSVEILSFPLIKIVLQEYGIKF
jgi:acyl carrier protein